MFSDSNIPTLCEINLVVKKSHWEKITYSVLKGLFQWYIKRKVMVLEVVLDETRWGNIKNFQWNINSIQGNIVYKFQWNIKRNMNVNTNFNEI